MAVLLPSGPTWRQNALINDLLEAVEADPNAVEARKLLSEQYQALGWHDAAADLAEEIRKLKSTDDGIAAIHDTNLVKDYELSPLPVRQGLLPSEPSLNLEELVDGYQTLRKEAADLLRELLVFQKLAPNADCLRQIAELKALVDGRMFSVVNGKVADTGAAKQRPVQSARALARSMKADRCNAVEVAISDFQNVVCETRKRKGHLEDDKETLRDLVRKRVDIVISALPEDMAYAASDAFMHVEHEDLRSQYANDETMLGDPISEVPRDMFWKSEDGYAWDMSELVQAIKANKGAMRNPLSRENFTVEDVEAIIRHPVGQELAAIHVEQDKLSRGVRRDTIVRLESMAEILLEDDSENSQLSHIAVDEFLSYVATLPAGEQEAIDNLRVPAQDTHTGAKFDASIGDSLRDARGNRVCFHKSGDLLRQAAIYLNKCNSS